MFKLFDSAERLLGGAIRTAQNAGGAVQRQVTQPIRKIINPNDGLPQRVYGPSEVPRHMSPAQFQQKYSFDEEGVAKLRPAPSIASRAKTAIGDAADNIVEAVDPWDAESQADRLLDSTETLKGIRPEFKKTIAATNPVFRDKEFDAPGLKGSKAVGIFKPGGVHKNSIEVADSNDDRLRENTATMLHEGLHAAWDKETPDQHREFVSLAQRAIPQNSEPVVVPGSRRKIVAPREYLRSRLGLYKAGAGMNINDFSTLSPSMQNELRSHIADYYGRFTGAQMSPDMQRYYSKYYDTERPRQVQGVVRSVHQLMEDRL